MLRLVTIIRENLGTTEVMMSAVRSESTLA